MFHNFEFDRYTTVICCFRRHSRTEVRDRLLGTKVSLIGATINTTCTTINSVNPDGESLEDQTYMITCPVTTEKTLSVLLFDDVMEQSYDADRSWLFINVAEVIVYMGLEAGKCSFFTDNRTTTNPKPA